MKKSIALLLVAVMCFSLAACGGDKETSNNNEPQTNNSGSQQEANNDTKTEKFDLYQEWKNVLTGASFTFDKNGTVTTEDGTEYKYEYDKKLEMISLYASMTVNLNITEENGVYKIGTEKNSFVTTDNYDELHAIAIEEAYTSNAEGATIVKIGESFAGVNGLNITINKVEIVDATVGSINLYITCENTTSEDVEFVNWADYYWMRGALLATSTAHGGRELIADDMLIPASSTKDIVITAKLDEDLTANNNVFLLIGIPYGEADENGQYKYNYVDVVPFYAE